MTISLTSTNNSSTINVNGTDILSSNATGEVSAKVNGTVQALSGLMSVGVAQTWQDVTGSRVATTTYTNTTGRPIFVSIYAGSASLAGTVYITVDGLQRTQATCGVATTLAGTAQAIIPNGSTYSITLSNWTISRWSELR